jgi:hypothetical protein
MKKNCIEKKNPGLKRWISKPWQLKDGDLSNVRMKKEQAGHHGLILSELG